MKYMIYTLIIFTTVIFISCSICDGMPEIKYATATDTSEILVGNDSLIVLIDNRHSKYRKDEINLIEFPDVDIELEEALGDTVKLKIELDIGYYGHDIDSDVIDSSFIAKTNNDTIMIGYS